MVGVDEYDESASKTNLSLIHAEGWLLVTLLREVKELHTHHAPHMVGVLGMRH
jgi:hypothetical protein